MTGDTLFPIEISRNNGIFIGGLQTHFESNGRKMFAKDSAKGTKVDSNPFTSLSHLKNVLAKAGQTLKIYRNAEGAIQISSESNSTANGENFKSVLSAIYKPVAEPTSTIANILKEKTFAPGVVQVCESFPTVSEKQDCLIELANLPIQQEDIILCTAYAGLSRRVECLQQLTH